MVSKHHGITKFHFEFFFRHDGVVVALLNSAAAWRGFVAVWQKWQLARTTGVAVPSPGRTAAHGAAQQKQNVVAASPKTAMAG